MAIDKVETHGNRSKWFAEGLKDLWNGTRRYHLWRALAAEDVRHAYRQTIFGAIWAVASFLVMAITILFVFSGGAPTREYAGFVATGLLAWNFISSIVTEGGTVFIAAEGYIKGVTLPISTYVFRAISRITLQTLYASAGAAAIVLWAGLPSSPAALAALPALVLYVLTAVPVQIILGLLCTYVRDFQYLIDNFMRPMFFITPIFWIAPAGSYQEIAARYNPFTHYIDIFRGPIVYDVIPWKTWVVCLAMTAVLWLIAAIAFARYRRRIVFWI